MSDTVPPTAEHILEEYEFLTSVHRKSSDNWRHGSTVEEVFFRDFDETYWWVCYRKQTNGEWNGLREGDYEICQVEPYNVVTIEYRAVKPQGEDE